MHPFLIPEIIIGSDFLKKVTPLIESAKQTIKIIVYDWRLYQDAPHHPVMKFVQSLQDAKRRGVSVQILIRNADIQRQLRQCGFDCKILYSGKLIHAKMMLIDDELAVIGSHNYTYSGFTQNLEISVAVPLGTDFNDLSVYFKNLWSV